MTRKKTHVVHVAEDISKVAGGVPAVVRELTQQQAASGLRVAVINARGHPDELDRRVQVSSFPPSAYGSWWSYGPGLVAGLRSTIIASPQDAVVHIHGVWSAPQFFAARVAAKANVPFLLSTHGMLEPWLWRQQGFRKHAKKQLYWEMLGRPSYSRASAIHAITPLERNNLARLFPKQRIEIIPNAVHTGRQTGKPSSQTTDPEPRILFLGRLEPKKGVDLLLTAFGVSKLPRNWVLDVVGPSWSEPYLRLLQEIVARYRLESRVKFHGALFGEEKQRIIDSAWVLVAPSFSEAVGLVNLEAAASRIPSITTPQTGLFDWEDGGGVLIEPTVSDVCAALEQAGSWSQTERLDRGVASQTLVHRRYSWDAVLPQWNSLYSSLES